MVGGFLGNCQSDGVRRGISELLGNTGVARRGIHPLGSLHECENRGVAAKGVCMNIKTKGVISYGVARRREFARWGVFGVGSEAGADAADWPAVRAAPAIG